MSRWIKSLVLLCFLAAVVFIGWLLRDTLLQSIGEFLIVRDFPAAADAIVVLSGESPERAMGAFDLYKEKLAPRILLTQEILPPVRMELNRRGLSYPSAAELDVQLLKSLGVPEKDITLLEPRCDSTYSESLAVQSFWKNNPPQKILLVTSRFHSRRARATFRRTLGSGTEVLSVPTPYDSFEPRSWWKRRVNIRNLLVEYQKGIFYEISHLWDYVTS